MVYVSVITPAYNEEGYIGKLLESIRMQKLKKVRIREVMVVANGCTDGTEEIVKRCQKKDSRIRLVSVKERLGMARAVNISINKTKSEILALVNADTVLERVCIERFVSPFGDKKIGVTAPRVIPLNKKDTLAGYFSHLWWKLLHEVALKHFRGGEVYAFRKLFKKVPEDIGSVENFITDKIVDKGYKTKYTAEAIAHNMGPQTILEVLNMRRRHNWLTYYIIDYGFKAYFPMTMDNWLVVKLFLKEVNWRNPREIYFALASAFLEVLSRVLAKYDYYVTRRSYYYWPRVESTKRLSL